MANSKIGKALAGHWDAVAKAEAPKPVHGSIQARFQETSRSTKKKDFKRKYASFRAARKARIEVKTRKAERAMQRTKEQRSGAL